MPSKSVLHITLLTSLFSRATAQKSTIPSDLSTAFSSSGTELQVSYTNQAVNGFQDGTTFQKDGAYTNAPIPVSPKH
jgi:hypothetical protein